MPELKIFTPELQKTFDTPPKLKKHERPHYFSIPKVFRSAFRVLKTPANKAGFILQLGYFRAAGKFFVEHSFLKRDINYVVRTFKLGDDVNFEGYTRKTRNKHRATILRLAHWHVFNDKAEGKIIEQIEWHTKQQMAPQKILQAVVDYCFEHRIEVPSYHKLSTLITEYYNTVEKELFKKIGDLISEEQERSLHAILSSQNGDTTPLINKMRTLNQSQKPKQIKQTNETFVEIKDLFFEHKNLMEDLDLMDHATEYFADWVRKAENSQLKSFADKNKLSLYLLATIKHQFFYRQDHLIELFEKSVKSRTVKVRKQLTQIEEGAKRKLNTAIKTLSSSNKDSRVLVEQIESVMKNDHKTGVTKVSQTIELIDEYRRTHDKVKVKQIIKMENMLESISSNATYYELLEQSSRSMQNRVADIVKNVEFNTEKQSSLLRAVNHFKATDGDVGTSPPLGFLSTEEKEAVSKDEDIRVSLYKALLFIHLSEAIKAGTITLQYSYKYRGFYDYMLSDELWHSCRDRLIANAGLEDFSDFNAVMKNLKRELGEKFDSVNKRWNNNENPYLFFGSGNKVRVRTPRVDKEYSEFIGTTLVEQGYVPIQKILSDINNVCRFTQSFRHSSNKNSKMKPLPEAIIAGIMGNGCNIGVTKIGKISVGVSEKSLRNTVKWFFDLENIQAASNSIISYVDKLSLANAFKYDSSKNHTSSDGQKFYVAVDSLMADFSFKYFGKDKGVTSYTFLDERQTLFYSTVISSSEREAAYVIDGLLNNDVVKSDIHSTDTHGYTEAIFGTTHFMGVGFAPRIKNIGSQTIYGFSAKKTYAKKGYKILPSSLIDMKLLETYWDDILRFMVTIKLKYASASQLFKRLNSYTKHLPLYKALKEFGRIIKSNFILNYYDDLELRQRMEKQLSRIELSNKFSKAIYFANNQEFQVGEKDEQDKVAACKVLIQNAVVLWNYLYLSEYIIKIKDREEKALAIQSVLEGSVLSWRHVNLQGEYDFIKHSANESQFDLDKILALNVG